MNKFDNNDDYKWNQRAFSSVSLNTIQKLWENQTLLLARVCYKQVFNNWRCCGGVKGVGGGKFLISIVLFHKQTTKVLFSSMNYQSMGEIIP